MCFLMNDEWFLARGARARVTLLHKSGHLLGPVEPLFPHEPHDRNTVVSARLRRDRSARTLATSGHIALYSGDEEQSRLCAHFKLKAIPRASIRCTPRLWLRRRPILTRCTVPNAHQRPR